ncbi:MAG: hypothetical protein ACKVZ0_07290 [Gemmatimonadales bacterium]
MRSLSQPLVAATVGLFLLGSAAAAGAQQAVPPPARMYVQVVRLKPEMVNEWLELQKNQVIPAQKKAGVTARLTMTTVVGNAFEYTLLTPFASWAAMDGDAPLVRALGAAGAAELNAKLRRCVAVQSSYLTTRRDSLSIPANDALVWRIQVRRAVPGKMQEYLAHFRADVLPAMQRAKAEGKIAGVAVAVRGAGAPAGEFTVTTMYNKFADLEGPNPVVAVLGQEAATKLAARTDELSTAGQIIVRRRVADLSF